jgi:8-oxo-dGTP diphosphatase
MTEHDGNGWTRCDLGHQHWGRYGAAGLLAYAPGAAGSAAAEPVVLLQRRARWGSNGGSWGPPGGARDSHESAVAAALREAAEECAVPADAVQVCGLLRDDHGGWCYQTVVAQAESPFPVRPCSSETSAVGWIAAADVAAEPLHPGFAARWPVLRQALQPLAIIVDAANVVGARPDGWWRDRAGAALRLRGQLAGLAAAGVAGLAEIMPLPPLDRWFPQIVLVVEGAARPAAAAHAAGGAGDDRAAGGGARGGRVRVVAARGSGDDAIAELASELPGRRLVVTADRELRARCLAAGASVTGPGWLLALLPARSRG